MNFSYKESKTFGGGGGARLSDFFLLRIQSKIKRKEKIFLVVGLGGGGGGGEGGLWEGGLE